MDGGFTGQRHLDARVLVHPVHGLSIVRAVPIHQHSGVGSDGGSGAHERPLTAGQVRSACGLQVELLVDTIMFT